MFTQKSMDTFYDHTLEEIYRTFSVDPEKGLNSDQVIKNRNLYGKNKIKKVRKSFFKVIISPIINILIIIYLLSAIAMWALGEIERTTPTFIIVGLNMLVAIIQQYRAEKQLKALLELQQPTTLVIKNGKEIEIKSSKVVVGNILKLTQGDKIPADARIIKAYNLMIDESSLTGESEPVRKMGNGNPITKQDSIQIHQKLNMLFFGTFIISGNCLAVAVRVGMQTEIGKISRLLEETTTGDIPLRSKTNNLAKKLGLGVLILLVLSIIYKSIIINQKGELTWDTFKVAMIDSIDLGMKVMPINLPILTTIVLLTGVLMMAKKKVIVRELSRTESLGRISVLCSDKTGTLTKNQMTVIKIWTPQSEYDVKGLGFAPDGKILQIDQSKDNTHLNHLILSGYLNNNSTLVQETIESSKNNAKQWVIQGIPTEGALLVLGKKYDTNIDQMKTAHLFIHEYPFDQELKRMSSLFQLKQDENTNSYIIYTKGATEYILPLCNYYQNGNEVLKLESVIKNTILKNVEKFSEQGYRILSLTYRKLEEELILDMDEMYDEKVRKEIEKDLIYLGFVVIYDPPREDVEKSIIEARNAGISVCMITGDSLTTAIAISKQLNIIKNEKDIAIQGKDIHKLSDEKFQNVVCFSRVNPEHKQLIVERYQKLGKVVSMSGDGVNDSLALSMADCGVAMGIQGTDVAKEASDMIITDDSFSTILTGIKEGRGLFMRIRTIVYFFVCISIMEAIILFSSTLGPNPNFAMFSFWQLNFLYITAHFFPSIGLIFMNNPEDIMEETPRNSAEILSSDLLKLIIMHIIIDGIAIVLIYYLCFTESIPISPFNESGIGYNKSQDAVPLYHVKARTMAFVLIFILESCLMPLQIRRFNKGIKESLSDIKYKEWGFYITALIMLIVCMYVLKIQEILGKNLSLTLNLVYLDGRDWVIIILTSIICFGLFEIVKKHARKKEIQF